MALLSPLLCQAADLPLEGRIFTVNGILPGAKVMLYTSFNDIQDGQPFAVSNDADSSGVYRLKVPQGEYYVVARGEQDGKRYFAYHGNNPIRVEKDGLWITLQAFAVPEPPVYTPGPTGIKGRLLFRGEPVEGAYVAIHHPDSKTFKRLGVKTESVDSDGRFSLAVPSGKYVVIGKKVASGKSNRPLQNGDLYCYYPSNPVEVREGQTARFDLSCYPKNDRASFVGTPKVKDNKLKTMAEQAMSSGSGIRGRVVDASGKPVPDMMVLAYRLAAPVFMMYHVYHGSEYSAMTDATGTFFIPVVQDGDYGIVARNVLGDGPHSGEIYGLYQGNSRHAVTYKANTLVENISITVGKVMGAPVGSDQEKNKKDRKAVSPRIVGSTRGKPVVLEDSVIDTDTVWQGNILIKGVINVQRGATLTIKPGTTVRFIRIDRDNNDIGDGEIMVEGRLVARGTADKKIIFASAEKKPAINDWSYLQFLAADPGNIIEHCQFENAFAGVMIHYADVRISDTIFKNNNRGIHYNTANMEVEHCTFSDNHVGIRFMRFEGNVKITDNEITRNDIGVLFVRQHVNAVDFEQLNKGKQPPRYERNNIYGNRNYNFSLGDGQDRDISVPGNWWGSSLEQKVAEYIYDSSKDEGLSKIFYEPFLSTAVPGAGVRKR